MAPTAPRGLCARCLFASLLEDEGQRINDRWRLAPPVFPRAFGSYELLEEIARGGMGIVYRARQTQAKRVVALKLMAGGVFAAPDFVQRFLTEAEAAGRLDHPNIVPIYEVGECEGLPFFSMKYLEGGTLARRIATGTSPIPSRAAVKWLILLSRAVQYAHQRGILHRDIKPGNVLLDTNGEPYLTDFGLARLVEKASTLTHTLAVLGTPSYMSPEHARGDKRQLTTAADVYGLGAILYELLTGQPPFAGGTTMETVRQVLERDPRRPAALRPGIDRDLETICLKCLQKDASRRYGSAEALATDLECWQRHEPILARPTPPLERIGKWVRRHKGGFAAIVTFLLLLLTGLAVSTVQARTQRELRRQAETNELRALEAHQKAADEAEKRRRDLVRMHVATGNEFVTDGDSFRGLLEFVEALRLEGGDARRIDTHRRRLAGVLRTVPRLDRLWVQLEGGLRTARFDPFGKRIVCGDERGRVQVFDAQSGLPLITPIQTEPPVELAWFTPDGRFLATSDSQGQLRHWDPLTAKPAGPLLPTRVISILGRTYFDCVDYSPDGRLLIAVVPDGVRFYSLPSGDPVGPLLAITSKVTRVRFSPSGRAALITGDHPALQLVETPSGRPLWTLPSLGKGARFASFSPNGRIIATASEDAAWDIDFWDIQRGERTMETVRALPYSYDLLFSPDGRWLALAGYANALLIDTRTGRTVGDRMRHAGHITQYEFSPDGTRLATSCFDHTARVWDTPSGRPLSPALRHAANVFETRFSPDGIRLLTACDDGTTRLWQLRGNAGERVTIHHPPSANSEFLIGPDSRYLMGFGGSPNVEFWDMKSGRAAFSWRESAEVTAAAFSPDGRRTAMAMADGRMQIRQVGARGTITGISAHRGRIHCVAFSPDGNGLLTAGDDGTVRLWNAVDGTPRTAALSHGGPVRQAMFSRDGHFVVTGSDDRTVRMWDAQTGVPIGRPLPLATSPRVVLLNADGRRLLTVRSGEGPTVPATTQLWDAVSRQPIGPERSLPDVYVYRAAFSPDGRRYLMIHDATAVDVCDSQTGNRITPALEHYFQPQGFAFSPDSRFVVTYAYTTARVWDASTGEAVSPFLDHADVIRWADWSPDGREILTDTQGGTLRIWDVSATQAPVEELAREAELLAAHRLDEHLGAVPLTPQELQSRWEARGAFRLP